MIDFLRIMEKNVKRGVRQIYPIFVVCKSSMLMIQGGDFKAVWLEDENRWSTDEQDLIRLVDNETKKYAESHDNFDGKTEILYMWNGDSGIIDKWHKYCKQQCRDNYHILDENLIFSNTETTKTDYASKRLPYPLEKGDHSAWDALVSKLYSPEERHKIEWTIGAIVSGDSKKIQKFLVFYGSAGTGKSTILNIIQQLFDGYYTTFDSKALGSSNNAFALEAFSSNPLVAIQHDGDLSRIEDNTRINSLVSHEYMTVNEKFKKAYTVRFNSFLLMGTNKPVRITDAKSGLIRRLIDVTPTGELYSPSEYKSLMKNVSFELGAIAYHCLEVYRSDPDIYDNYIPIAMMGASNDFYNYVLESYYVFKDQDNVTLKQAWEMYKNYCEDARVPYPMTQRVFKEELKNYFENFAEREILENGERVRSYYTGFKTNAFKKKAKEDPELYFVNMNCKKSVFDKDCSNFPAQYANDAGTPQQKWSNVTTTLADIDTSKLHYVKVPKNHIVIDFDIPDENGDKSSERNLVEASKFPPTYAEFSKSGKGVHLHYIYLGDPDKLSPIYADHIEVKVFRGNSSLRRCLTKCNNLPIATISSAGLLPLKEEKGDKMVNPEQVKSEKGLRSLIERNLRKEIMPNTKPSIDFIKKILDDAYASGLKYDVTDLRPAISAFATNSTHQALYCIKLVEQMKFSSEEPEDPIESVGPLAIYDIEVFPNVNFINWKEPEDLDINYVNSLPEKERVKYVVDKISHHIKPVNRMVNPTPEEIENLFSYRLIGHNCRRYDNHISYGILLGHKPPEVYKQSAHIVANMSDGYHSEAWNKSYTDTLDYPAKKQSLKKWEIEFGFHHQELGFDWNQPVQKTLWEIVAQYCDNDVLATEILWWLTQGDFTARKILAALANMTVNDTTNCLTTRIIFGTNKKPQGQFNYRFMGDETSITLSYNNRILDFDPFQLPMDRYTAFDKKLRPVFPGYEFDHGKSYYRGVEVGEGGRVYAEPGIYGHVKTFDVASMHPHSIIAEELFGPYTQTFKDLVDARIAIKHKDFERARTMLNGKLAPFLTDESVAKDLAQALKIAINSVYGLTAAKFENPFRDPRNIDNIVAKRGALFMINLQHEVQRRGFKVVHIKTDSIKIADPTPEIEQFVLGYGALYGYTFEVEDEFDRICLVNDAVYIARETNGNWTATGAQFAEPYVFKTLFSKEPIEFDDLCRTNSVSGDSALYLDFNENLPEGEHNYTFIGKVGQFCPMVEGAGGGILYRYKDDKYYAATGTKGYRWMESEMVRSMEKQDQINLDYWDHLVHDAIINIESYCFGDMTLDWFTSDRPMPEVKIVNGVPEYPTELPFN